MMHRESTIRILRSRSDVGALSALDVLSTASPWDSKPLRVLLQTHIGVPAARIPHSVRVSVVIDTPIYNLLGQVEGLVQFAPPHLNLRVYVCVKADTNEKYVMSFNGALSNASIAENTSVDITILEITSGTKQQTRLFKMAWHALYELQHGDMQDGDLGFVMLLHRSCVVDSNWEVSTLQLGGRGFLLLNSDITAHTLYDEVAAHDLGVTSESIRSHRHSAAYTPPPFHCSGSIMHALHTTQPPP